MEKELVQTLQNELSLQLNESITEEKIKEIIAAKVNDLIRYDFPQLTQLLYRIDINEQRLKKLLNEAGEKATAEIIAELIVERQIQKFESRKLFKPNENEINEEEKW